MDNHSIINVPYMSINAKCCCFNFRKVSRAITQFFDRQLESSGVRGTQFTLLVELSSVKAKTLTEIANGLVMDRTTLTRNLKPLEKQGFIVGTETNDKRAKAYMLTAQGKAILEKAAPLWEKAQITIVSALGEQRYEALLAELQKTLSVLPEENGFKKSI